MTGESKIVTQAHRITQLIVDDDVIQAAADDYAHTTLKNWGIVVPQELSDFDPYWSLVTTYMVTLCATVSLQISTRISD